ncbi:uncharacterized protein ASPGLDRAFT_994284 [Aspergillus glaucus CBS 516.65]|uniref:Uncharacterized protein n=1 Tax=Aspergillus glaucus CBS 516.65 TaxID=1160497 RepID=A0A1L9VV44_ASPGL|nr:hypothetical protein ASPGLDRAFT_994284 [Aspergillus glaucus CBS 516.65]OJJ87793.1 hypothetical protein ASPGLDRAFT_994284 [Aspergillus glaucus CBS 516.65]
MEVGLIILCVNMHVHLGIMKWARKVHNLSKYPGKPIATMRQLAVMPASRLWCGFFCLADYSEKKLNWGCNTNWEAMQVQTGGTPQDLGCNHCQKGHGLFQSCMVMEGKHKGSCAMESTFVPKYLVLCSCLI